MKNPWGVEFTCSKIALAMCKAVLNSPFDPFVEEVLDKRGNYHVLRSSAFDGLPSAAEVNQTAKRLFSTLNVAMSTSLNADPITPRAVVEFVEDSPPHKHNFVELGVIDSKVQCFPPSITITDANGNVVPSEPSPSRVQEWMRAAAAEKDIGAALCYLEGKADWVELYKAYEALCQMPNGGISKRDITRFKQTANTTDRHHPDKTRLAHRNPMELPEARALLTQWVSAAVGSWLAQNP